MPQRKHASYCPASALSAQTLATSGCWRRGWPHADGGDQHVNLCNKCGLRYKHGRLPETPAARPSAPPAGPHQAISRPEATTIPIPASTPTVLSPLQLHHRYQLQQQRQQQQQQQLQLLHWQQLQQAKGPGPAGGSVSADPLHKLLAILPRIKQEAPVPASTPIPEHLGTDEAAPNAGVPIRVAGGSSDEDLPLKRPCSRTRRDAAMTLMWLNG